MLVKEIFETSQNLTRQYPPPMEEFLSQVIPVLILKTGYEKKFIQNEAK